MILLKYLHITCALLSITLFVLRGLWKLTNNPLLTRRIIKIAPHIVDFLLLTSGVVMLFIFSLNPLVSTWLLAKFIALVVYIVLGLMTLRFAQKRSMIFVSFIAACGVFGYIVLVASTHQILPLLNL